MPARKKKDEPVVETTATIETTEISAKDVKTKKGKKDVLEENSKPTAEIPESEANVVQEETPSVVVPLNETGDTETIVTSGESVADVPPNENTADASPDSLDDVAALTGDEKISEKSSDVLPAGKSPDVPKKTPKQTAARKKTIYDLDLNDLDRNLSPEQQQEWSAVYASYRSKSILNGVVVGVDENTFDVKNRESGKTERKSLISLIVIGYRVKILIPDSEMWMPGEERPSHVLRQMVGSKIDYVVLEVDREGDCAVASRRMALSAKRHFFDNARTAHKDGDALKCTVLSVGAKQCLVECNGYDLRLSQRDLSYTAIADLREKYRPGQELDCLFKSFNKETGRLTISVKETYPNPFIGADKRHPVGSRRQAVISGKYGGGVFCTLPDDTTCLCLYSTRHEDCDFSAGDTVIIAIRQYDYQRQLIYGRILSKW